MDESVSSNAYRRSNPISFYKTKGRDSWKRKRNRGTAYIGDQIHSLFIKQEENEKKEEDEAEETHGIGRDWYQLAINHPPLHPRQPTMS